MRGGCLQNFVSFFCQWGVLSCGKWKVLLRNRSSNCQFGKLNRTPCQDFVNCLFEMDGSKLHKEIPLRSMYVACLFFILFIICLFFIYYFFIFLINKVTRIHNINSIDIKLNFSTSGKKKICLHWRKKYQYPQ